MKIKSVKIINIGLIKNETIQIDKPLIILFGEICNGKTTFLNTIKVCLGGKVPQDFIRNGEDSGSIELEIENGTITRKLKKRADGSYMDNFSVIINNKSVGRKGLKDFVNPFQLDQDFFKKKNLLDRIKYFIELFNIDTTSIDLKINNLFDSNKDLRSEIKGMGDLELEKVEKIDEIALKKEWIHLNEKNQLLEKSYNENVIKFNESALFKKTSFATILEIGQKVLDAQELNRIDSQKDLEVFESDIKHLEAAYKQKVDSRIEIFSTKTESLIEQENTIRNQMKSFIPVTEPIPFNELPEFNNTKEISDKIINAKTHNELYKKYLEEKERVDLKIKKMDDLKTDEDSLKKHRKEKSELIKSVKVDEQIEGLVIDDEGKIRFEGSDLSMISDSQEMRLSSLISALYPNCFDIELVDRGESLGNSIFDLVEKAKQQERTIICTVVSDNPAHSSDEIGTYWVENGNISNSDDYYQKSGSISPIDQMRKNHQDELDAKEIS